MAILAFIIALVVLFMVISTRTKLFHKLEILEIKIKALESFIKNIGDGGILQPPKESTKETREATPAKHAIAPAVMTTVPDVEKARDKPEEGPPARKVPKKPAKPQVSFKEQIENFIGQNLSIWVGAAALVVAGGYFIKYAYDNDLLSPWVRTGFGYLVVIIAIGAAEKFKKTLGRVSEGLASAGVGLALGVTWSAVNVLNLFPPAIGFVVMAIIAAFGVLLSLRFGPVVAVVGMLGGFLTPILMDTGSGNHIALFLYLMALLGGVAVLARKTGWYWMLTLASIGINGWALAWIGGLFETEFVGWFSFFIFASMLIIAGGSYSWDGQSLVEKKDVATANMGFGSASLRKWQTLLALVFTAYVTLKVPFTFGQWSWVALLGISLIVLERFESRYKLFAWGGFLVPAIALWSALDALVGNPEGGELVVLLGLFGSYAVLAFLLQFKAGNRAYWTTLSGASLWYIYFQGEFNFGATFPLNPTALSLSLLAASGVLFLATWTLQREKVAEKDLIPALSPYFLTALGFLNIVFLYEVKVDYLAAVFAAEIFALTLLPKPFNGMTMPIGRGSSAVAFSGNVLFLASGVFILWGLAVNIGWEGLTNFQESWSWPWHLELLALPALFFFLANRKNNKKHLFNSSTLLTFLFVSASIRYLFHDGHVVISGFTGVPEVGAYLVVWGALGLAIMRQALAAKNTFSLALGKLFLNAGIIYAALVLTFFGNPFLTGVPVGDILVLNGLIWLYVPPLLMIFLINRTYSEHVFIKETPLNLLAFILLFVLITLEVRQGFAGTLLAGGASGEAEKYAYSFTWLLSGIAIMVSGIGLKNGSLRLAGLIFVSIATTKIFLYDTASLSGLYRVASFAALGVSSLGIAWLYKRFVKISTK